MTRIVQIVPEMRPGSGVEAVAFHLEDQWDQLGARTARFTLEDAFGGWLPEPASGALGKLVLAARVIWFSSVGTAIARGRFRDRSADTVVICHNDVLFGDVYVNHGIVAEAMRSRGHALGRMVRNPLHTFTWLRDAVRFASGTHDVVVSLTTPEISALRRTYPRTVSRTVVIGNGVDIERYRPEPSRRDSERERLGIPKDAMVALFVGHEFDRKGLPAVLEAMGGLSDSLHLVVVGGAGDMVAAARRTAESFGVAGRVHFTGKLPDPRTAFHASDFFVFPSAYESYGLVVLEALACGLPVVATPVGCVPDVIRDSVNGYVVSGVPAEVRWGMQQMLEADRAAMGQAARIEAETHSWRAVAKEYLRLFDEILAARR